MRFQCALAVCLLTTATPILRAQALPEWRLHAAPLLVLNDDGSPEREFTRIVGAFQFANGRIAIVDNGSSQVRVFGADGTWLRNVGREGSGPGEFQFALYSFVVEDTLYVFDPMLRRVTGVTAVDTPRVVSTRTMDARGDRGFEVHGRLFDGRWVTRYVTDMGWTAPRGVNRTKASFGLASADGSSVSWYADLPGTAWFVNNPTGSIQTARLGPIAFTPAPYAVSSAAVMWYGESSNATLLRVDGTTNTRRTVQLPIAERAPTRELIAARRAEDEGNDSRASVEFLDAKYSAEYIPRSLPYYEALVPTGDGGVWVQEFAGVRALSARYLVLDSEGRAVARIITPAHFRVTHVRGTNVIGVYRDADGVESVRVYQRSAQNNPR